MNLYLPTMDDLWFREEFLADPETMSYNHAYGGTIPFPREKWAAWYDRWVTHHEGKRFYRYLMREDGTFVGEIAYHLDEECGMYLADVIVHAKYRGHGYGRAGLELLGRAAKDNGVRVLYDDNGFLSILNNTEPCHGKIDNDGRCNLHGKIVTLIKEIVYDATGYIRENEIVLTLKSEKNTFCMKGTAQTAGDIVVYVLQKLVDLRFGIADFRTFTEKLGQRIFQFCYFVQGKSLQSF